MMLSQCFAPVQPNGAQQQAIVPVINGATIVLPGATGQQVQQMQVGMDSMTSGMRVSAALCVSASLLFVLALNGGNMLSARWLGYEIVPVKSICALSALGLGAYALSTKEKQAVAYQAMWSPMMLFRNVTVTAQ